MTTRTGWKVVCPDGKERHYPYGNHGDALCDARVFRRIGCTRENQEDSPEHASEKREWIERCGACPEGEHTVEPHVFVLPPPTGSA